MSSVGRHRLPGMTTTDRSLDLPGLHLHYEVRGSGPLVLLVGAPMAAADFAGFADVLAADHTVVTHDPRGISRSRLDDPEQDSTPDLRADDVAALLDALGAESADVFGSSGGAVTGLALVARHPGRVRTLVAHEPPLLDLLPDAAGARAAVDHMIETFRTAGPGPAFHEFMVFAGFIGEDAAAPGPPAADQAGPADQAPPPEAAEQAHADATRFFLHELRGTTTYQPDIAALREAGPGVVIGIGAASGKLVTDPTSRALAELLGTKPVEFPGDHGGFIGQPVEFAAVLREVLAGTRV
jgi:pimeloyl-ACP methyl ester carboxylesterase